MQHIFSNSYANASLNTEEYKQVCNSLHVMHLYARIYSVSVLNLFYALSLSFTR